MILPHIVKKIINKLKYSSMRNIATGKNQTISEEGIEVIKSYEGFVPTPYKCPAGKLTIGYGHVLKKNDYHKDPLTKEQGNKLLKEDLRIIELYINNSIKVPLNQGQFDALCSLIYNWGIGNFGNSKGFKLLQEGEYTKASKEFFSKEKGVVNINGVFSNGLYARRREEMCLWQRTN